MEKFEKQDVYTLRCFLNGKRKLSNKLTKNEARNFYITALHLSRYLYKSYNLVEEFPDNIKMGSRD